MSKSTPLEAQLIPFLIAMQVLAEAPPGSQTGAIEQRIGRHYAGLQGSRWDGGNKLICDPQGEEY